MRFLALSLVVLTGLISTAARAGSAEQCGEEARPCVEYGALVFQQRCALCHGSDGLGEGILPLSVKDYPKTNLLEPRYGTDPETVMRIVTSGGARPPVSPEMPPWGDELTATQLESVVEFVGYLRQDLDGALAMLRNKAKELPPSLKTGRAIFLGRCALCHGRTGEGNGKMARIIKNPPPFNLTRSGAPDDYLRRIISGGGASVGRSPRMPPWGNDLSANEIDSVILFIKTLRNY